MFGGVFFKKNNSKSSSSFVSSSSQAGKLSTAEALQLALAYENETELAVWNDLDQSIGKVAVVWQDTKAMPGGLFKFVSVD